MSEHYVFTSLTRIADLRQRAFDVQPLDHGEWATGDYVVGEVIANGGRSTLEYPSGRYGRIEQGDRIVSAFGRRAATLEINGDWRQIRDDLRMHVLSGGGILGRVTSRSMAVPEPPTLVYRGHVMCDAVKRTMASFVEGVPERRFETPTILIVGSSMSAGKTTAARAIVRQLRDLDLRVAGAKLTGAGRYHDILTMRDAGADPVFDFVDAGLPSTVCPEDTYAGAVRGLLSRIAAAEPEVLVVEAGASPLEPYNGEGAVDALGDAVKAMVLCATDPYAVLGVIEGFGRRPDLVTGIASNTEASIALVERLTGLPAINVRDRDQLPELRAFLASKLEIG